MANTVKYPIGIQDFEKLRSEGFLYVDKTLPIKDLVDDGKYYFLSRPRRFGKSLLLSTIAAFFEGKRELFKGLAIDSDEMGWEPHPVIRIDLNAEKYDTKESLETLLNKYVSFYEDIYGRTEYDVTISQRFDSLIRNAYKKTGKRVVILVDEYDKPMLQSIGNPELQDEYRNILKSFYGVLKSLDGSIRFVMMTGVTKFGKVSVFSDLNHLTDISMDTRYYDICGMTEAELHDYFDESIAGLARANEMGVDECYTTLKERYDGYHFSEDAPGVYNPFSLLQTLDKGKFGSYWFETGTPTYLVKLLQMHDYNLEAMSEVETDADVLNSTDGGSTDPIPVIYQSGYLTIKGYNKEFGLYKLGFPNKEVEEGFMKFLVPYYTNIPKSGSAFEIGQFVMDVRSGRTEQFIKRLKSFFADTPYELVKDLENHYQNVLFIIARLMGLYTKVEYRTSEGRIDMVIQTPQYCYVLEFKLDGTARQALEQIKNKNYTLPFEMNGQKIILIGMNFSSESRNIDGVEIEEL